MKGKNLLIHLPFYLLIVFMLLGFAHLGSQGVSAFQQLRTDALRHTIVIDAGHGGIDGGATSVSGKLESGYNLEIALRLNDLCHLLGMDTAMIRTTDTSIYTEGKTIGAQKISDLKERVRIINDARNAVLVSIHQNTYSDSRYNGAQVFYAGTPGSDALAKKLQTAFVNTVNPGSSRLSKRSKNVFLMERIDCTGVLIECGFLSNPEEDAKLQQDDYQKQLCCVIVATLSEYLN